MSKKQPQQAETQTPELENQQPEKSQPKQDLEPEKKPEPETKSKISSAKVEEVFKKEDTKPKPRMNMAAWGAKKK